MTFQLGRAPNEVQLGSFAQQVLDTVGRYTAFPWPIYSVQCQRLGIDPGQLTSAELGRVAKNIATGVARFTSQEKGEKLLVELIRLSGGLKG